jgi:hypothetical protein
MAAAMLTVAPSHAAETKVPWSASWYQFIATQFGEGARTRLANLETLVEEHAESPVLTRLQVVNEFFDDMPWGSDSVKWRQRDIGQPSPKPSAATAATWCWPSTSC